MALRAAQNMGVKVPQSAIDRAMKFLGKCFNNGGFAYTPGRPPAASVTSEAVHTCQMCGFYEDDLVKEAADNMVDIPLSTAILEEIGQEMEIDLSLLWGSWSYYAVFFYSPAAYQLGGKYEKEAQMILEKILIPTQKEDGGWYAPSGNEQNAGPIYSTSMAILALTVRYNYLPIFQK